MPKTKPLSKKLDFLNQTSIAETFIKFKDFLSIDVIYNDNILLKRWKKTNKAFFEPPETLNFPVVDKNGKPKDKIKRKWKQKINLTYKGKEVKGFFIIMKTGSYVKHPGIRLFRNRRVIQGTLINPNSAEVLLGTKNKYASQRLYGEIHLNDFEIDFMKTKFIDDLNPLYIELKKELKKEPNFMDQVNFYRSKQDKINPPETEDSPDEEKKETIIVKKPSGEIKTKKSLKNITKIQKSKEVELKLSQLNKKKLVRLYDSLCTISLIKHPYLCYIGSWAFLESLSVYMGKKEKQSFDSFFGSKLNEWYKNQKQDKNKMHDAIKQIHTTGNFAKHDFEYEFSDAKQLHYEFKVLEEFIVKCIDNIQEN